MKSDEFVLLATGFLVLLTALAKLLVGHLFRVPALIADGYHGLADAVIDLGGYAIVKASRSGSVSGGRLNYFFSFLVSEFLIATGILIAFENLGIEALRSPIPFLTTVAAAITILAASRWRHATAKATGSPVLEAEAMHGYSDVASTLGAMIGSLYPYYDHGLDAIGLAIVVAVMLLAGLRIGIDSVKMLVEYIPSRIREVIEAEIGPAEIHANGVYYVITDRLVPPDVEKSLSERLGVPIRLIYRRGNKKAVALDSSGRPAKFGDAEAFLIIDGTSRTLVKNPFRGNKHRGVLAMRRLIDMGVSEVYAKDFGRAVEEVFAGLVKLKKSSELAEREDQADLEGQRDQ